jgi:hypothetical protein
MPDHFSSMRAFHHWKTPNMATQIHARNRTNVRSEKIVEQETNSWREFSENVFARQAVRTRPIFPNYF